MGCVNDDCNKRKRLRQQAVVRAPSKESNWRLVQIWNHTDQGTMIYGQSGRAYSRRKNGDLVYVQKEDVDGIRFVLHDPDLAPGGQPVDGTSDHDAR